MNEVRAVIFDAYGTLLKIQGGRHPYRRLLRLGQANGRRPRPDDAHILMQEPLTLTQAADRLGIRATQGELADLEQLLADEVAEIEPYDDGLEAVALLQREGIRVGVCSNLAYPYRDAILMHYPTLDAYAFSCELGVIKPDAGIYNATCELLGALPDLTLMIGDSRRCDRDGPREMGIKGYFLDRSEGSGDYRELVSFAQDVCETRPR
ncbi:HAD family hydrolase [Stutzerimonas stutzeri]|uniref:HAD family hydrolase n=1 Tax=Stutzerimonas stutzeri TaxID=316 RepID=UPI00244C49FF|nr:HAD family hydrolase [Stutzerimonas stutzeri]MDH1557044.1 HAD family hydrolase [Stutzerimonas stutzeri]